jgi:hypothetical protein
VVSAYPLLNFFLQCPRDGAHFFHFTMGYAAADIIVAYISLFAERNERPNELCIFSHGQF